MQASRPGAAPCCARTPGARRRVFHPGAACCVKAAAAHGGSPQAPGGAHTAGGQVRAASACAAGTRDRPAAASQHALAAGSGGSRVCRGAAAAHAGMQQEAPAPSSLLLRRCCCPALGTHKVGRTKGLLLAEKLDATSATHASLSAASAPQQGEVGARLALARQLSMAARKPVSHAGSGDVSRACLRGGQAGELVLNRPEAGGWPTGAARHRRHRRCWTGGGAGRNPRACTAPTTQCRGSHLSAGLQERGFRQPQRWGRHPGRCDPQQRDQLTSGTHGLARRAAGRAKHMLGSLRPELLELSGAPLNGWWLR